MYKIATNNYRKVFSFYPIMRSNKKSTLHSVWCSLLASFLAVNFAFARQELHDERLTTKISRYYLRSFSTVTLPEQKEEKDMFLRAGKPQLAKSTQCKIILRTIFSNIEANDTKTDDQLLNYNAWGDLTLFCGASSNPSHHLLSRINRTTTLLGECALAALLVTPSNDMGILSNRQKIIRFFLEQPDHQMHLKQLLMTYRNIEPSFLSFWTHTDPLYTKEYQEYLHSRFLFDSAANNKIAGKLRRKVFFRNIRDIYGEFLVLPVFGLLWCESHYLVTSIAKGGFISGSRTESYAPISLFMPGWSIGSAVYNYTHTNGNPSLLPFLGVAITNGMAVWRGYCGVKHYKEYNAVFQNLACRMLDVQVFMRTIQQVSHAVAKNPELEAVYAPYLKKIRVLLSQKEELTEIGVMLRNLLEMKLDHWSYFSSDNSKLLATLCLFEAYKDHLKPAMYELGQLDSFIGIAELVEEAKKISPEHYYTFAKFLDRSEQITPLLKFDGMWNTLIDPTTVIDNDVELDTYKTRNMILCGPNAGGKSSFLSGVASGVLLAQTFGIVPAKEAIITPFNKIHTYIEVGDDIASGASLFMVEMGRMLKHIHMLEKSKSTEFIFTIADEPFAGTNPTEAGAVAYSIVSYMAKYTNSLHIIASHYPILMGLEHNIKGGGIKNFKVFVREESDNKLHYTYKIVPGEAHQAVALKILEQEGYDSALLTQAENIVKYPEKFHKIFSKSESNPKP